MSKPCFKQIIFLDDGYTCCILDRNPELTKKQKRDMYELSMCENRNIDDFGKALFIGEKNKKIFYAHKIVDRNIYTLSIDGDQKSPDYYNTKKMGKGSYGDITYNGNGLVKKHFRGRGEYVPLERDFIMEASVYNLIEKLYCTPPDRDMTVSCCSPKFYDLSTNDIFIQKGGGTLHRILDKGGLTQFNQNISGIIKQLMFRLLICMKKIAQQGVIHCDLKPANIIVAKGGSIFPIDWGISEIDRTEYGNLPKNTWKQTPMYQAPEIQAYLGQNMTYKYTYKIDIYSLGLIFLEIVYGRLLYPEKEDMSKKYLHMIFGKESPLFAEIGNDYTNPMLKDVENPYELRLLNSIYRKVIKTGIKTYEITKNLKRFLRERFPSYKPVIIGEEYDLFLNMVVSMIHPVPSKRATYDMLLTHEYFSENRFLDKGSIPPVEKGYVNVMNTKLISGEWMGNKQRSLYIEDLTEMSVNLNLIPSTLALSIQLLDLAKSLLKPNNKWYDEAYNASKNLEEGDRRQYMERVIKTQKQKEFIHGIMWKFGCFSLAVKLNETVIPDIDAVIKKQSLDIINRLKYVDKIKEEITRTFDKYIKYVEEKLFIDIFRGNILFPTISATTLDEIKNIYYDRNVYEGNYVSKVKGNVSSLTRKSRNF